MPIKAVIFDLGGVLVRTEDRGPRTQLAARLGKTYAELGMLIFDSGSSQQAQLGEITSAQHWEQVRNALNISPAELLEVRGKFWEGDSLDGKLVDYLRGLQPRYKTALLSNAWDDLRQMIEDVWQIDNAFDQLIISAEIGLVKPDLVIYQWMLAELGLEPSHAVFVDDFQHNVEGAQAAGLHAIHFRSPDQALGELQTLLEIE
jgi:epoxide hydrolase-like predicted phosphatase